MEWGSQESFSFLSQDTIVIPKLHQNTLEAFKIVIDSDDTPLLVPLCVLHLPLLTPGASLHHINCRAEPNPTSSGPVSISSSSDRPFRDKAEDGIIIFDIFYGNLSGPDEFTFIMHRSAPLAHVPVARGACANLPPTPPLRGPPPVLYMCHGLRGAPRLPCIGSRENARQ